MSVEISERERIAERRRRENAEARIAELEATLREAETHLGGYMGSKFTKVEELRARIRALLTERS